MAVQTTSSSGLTAQYQKVFSKKLLEHAIQLTVLNQFGVQVSFPKNAGAKVMRFLRANVGDRTQVQALTEGVPISTFRDITWTPIDVTLAQRGEAARVSDILQVTELFPTLKQATTTLGEDAALDYEFLVQTALLDTTNSTLPINTANNRFAQGITSYNNLVAATASGGAVVIQDFLGAMTRLKKTRAPKINGTYVGIVPPEVSYDFMNDAKFTNASQYGTIQGMFNGELGKWYNVRMVETTVPWQEANTNGAIGTYSGSGTIFTSLVLGSQAFCVPEMGGMSELNPRMIIVNTPDSTNPLNQYTTIGWKGYWAAGTTNDLWAVALRSKTTFV